MTTPMRPKRFRRLTSAVLTVMVIDVVLGAYSMSAFPASAYWLRWVVLGVALLGMVAVGFVKNIAR
jgi:hypothetical protein